MDTAQVLQWEMYGGGTAVEFSALRDENGFGLIVKRENEVLIAGAAADGATLFRKSSQLRECLEQLGFGAKPAAARAAQMDGGLCWGPATPLQSSLIDALTR